MLKGERVILRATERDDLKTLYALERNIDLVLLGNGAWQPAPVAAWEKDFDKHLEDDKQAWFVIEVDGVVIGGCGLHHSHRRDGSTEFGIGIYHADYIGKGYGREAVALLLDWAFRIQNWHRVGLTTLATNERAVRAYLALGFVEEGRVREQTFVNGRYEDVLVMGLLANEWAARRQ